MGLFRTLTAAALGAALVNWLANEQRARTARPGSDWLDDVLGNGGTPGTAVGRSGPAGFTLESPEIKAGGMVDARFEFDGFDCSGDNKSPALVWTGAPEDTQSFALTLYDPDAPSGSGWWHWVLIDLPADSGSLTAGAGDVGGASLPAGARQLRNDYGQAGFGGVCPPRGDRPHRYVFTLYALKVPKLEIPDDATAALAGFMIHSNALGQASFTARYGRPRA